MLEELEEGMQKAPGTPQDFHLFGKTVRTQQEFGLCKPQ